MKSNISIIIECIWYFCLTKRKKYTCIQAYKLLHNCPKLTCNIKISNGKVVTVLELHIYTRNYWQIKIYYLLLSQLALGDTLGCVNKMNNVEKCDKIRSNKGEIKKSNGMGGALIPFKLNIITRTKKAHI